jgi:predicted ATPase
MKRFVLTGTAGAGKTAIIRQLEREGFGIVEEAATDVIALEQACGIAEPWKHPSFIDNRTGAHRRRNLGFITPSEARRIGFEEALRFERIHEETYSNFGFEIVSIEPGSVPDRVAAIKQLVGRKAAPASAAFIGNA